MKQPREGPHLGPSLGSFDRLLISKFGVMIGNVLCALFYSLYQITVLCWAILYNLYFNTGVAPLSLKQTQGVTVLYYWINGKRSALNIMEPRHQDLYCAAKVPYLLLPLEGIWQLDHNICNNIIETLKNDFSIHEQPREPRMPRQRCQFLKDRCSYIYH